VRVVTSITLVILIKFQYVIIVEMELLPSDLEQGNLVLVVHTYAQIQPVFMCVVNQDLPPTAVMRGGRSNIF